MLFPEKDGPPTLAWAHLAVAAVALLLIAHRSLLFTYPAVWAGTTLIAVIMLSGALTSKVFFRFEGRLLGWLMAPIFGVGWVVLFWAVWLLFRVLSG